MNIITDLRVLRGMKKAKLIKFHPHTGTKITPLHGGKPFTCFYIDDLEADVPAIFTYKGNKYRLTYISGSFFPYIEAL